MAQTLDTTTNTRLFQVPDLATLALFGPARRQDRDLIFVADQGALYLFSWEMTGDENSPYLIVPTDGPGRFQRLEATALEAAATATTDVTALTATVADLTTLVDEQATTLNAVVATVGDSESGLVLDVANQGDALTTLQDAQAAQATAISDLGNELGNVETAIDTLAGPTGSDGVGYAGSGSLSEASNVSGAIGLLQVLVDAATPPTRVDHFIALGADVLTADGLFAYQPVVPSGLLTANAKILIRAWVKIVTATAAGTAQLTLSAGGTAIGATAPTLAQGDMACFEVVGDVRTAGISGAIDWISRSASLLNSGAPGPANTVPKQVTGDFTDGLGLVVSADVTGAGSFSLSLLSLHYEVQP